MQKQCFKKKESPLLRLSLAVAFKEIAIPLEEVRGAHQSHTLQTGFKSE